MKISVIRRTFAILLIAVLIVGGIAAAQSASPTAPATATPLILGAVNVITPTPIPTMTPTPTATPIPPDDPRPAICSAPYQPGFVPHVIRPGERLADLMVGVLNLTVTQVTALNCLDDASALPVGAVIWLPAGIAFATADVHDSNAKVDAVKINSLSASSEKVQNLAAVTFSWSATGSAAYFYTCNPDPVTDCTRPVDAQPVPLSYTTPDISGFRYAGTMRYRLEVVDGTARTTQDVSIEVLCSQEMLGQYNGLTPCPDEPLHSVTAAMQPFQHGLMLWFSDTHKIWVMTDADHRVQVVDDLYQDGDPDPTDVPPSGLYRPMRGFGRVWAMDGGANGLLGWATDRENGVDVARQPAGRVSYTTYMQPQGGAIYAVTIPPGEDSGWWMEVSGNSATQ